MNRLLSPFWNRQESRIRAGWRLLIHLVCYLLAQLSPTFLIGDRHENALHLTLGTLSLTHRAVFVFLGMLAVVFVTWLVGALLDRRPFSEFGLHVSRQWWLELLFGAILGATLMALIFVSELGMGWIAVTELFRVQQKGLSFEMAMLSPLLLFIGVAIQEELLSRGYEIRNFAEGIRFSWLGEKGAILAAWIFSSALFGLLHFFNPNATWISTFNIMLAGLFFGLGYVLTGRLALSIGLHLTWNLFQGNIFGFPVSGNEFNDVTLIAIKQSGPIWWTGGNFGPEAGLIGVAAICLGSLLILLWIRWMNKGLALQRYLANYSGQRSQRERKIQGIV